VTHRHDSDPPANPDRERRPSVEDDLEAVREKSFFALIPRRDLTKAALLVVLLVVIVALQRRSGAIVRGLTRGLYGPPAQVMPREPPRVQLAPRQP
jgi:hypothetical protein